MSRTRALALGIASAALFSCTLLVDLDGLAEPRADGGVRDGGPEAGADADATTDGATDGALNDPCSLPGVLYCTRFDNSAALAAFRPVTDPTTRIDVVTSAFFSAPAAAAFTIDPSSNGSADATLALTVGTNVSRAAFTGMIRIDKSENVAGRLLAMRIGTVTSVTLDRSGDIRQSGTGLLGTARAIPADQWVRLRVEIDRKPVPPTIAVTVGDAVTQVPIGTSAWAPGEVTVVFGISETSTPTNGWLVRWDDVVIQSL